MIQRFGAKLRILRKRQAMTLRELAAALGYAGTGYLSDIEFGKKYPTAQELLRALRGLIRSNFRRKGSHLLKTDFIIEPLQGRLDRLQLFAGIGECRLCIRTHELIRGSIHDSAAQRRSPRNGPTLVRGHGAGVM